MGGRVNCRGAMFGLEGGRGASMMMRVTLQLCPSLPDCLLYPLTCDTSTELSGFLMIISCTFCILFNSSFIDLRLPMISFCLFSSDFCLSSANFSDSIWQLIRLILFFQRITAGLSLSSLSRLISSMNFYSFATLLDRRPDYGILSPSGTRFFVYNFAAISSIILLFYPLNPCRPSNPEVDMHPFCRSNEDLIFLRTSIDFYRRTDDDLPQEKDSSHLCCSQNTSRLLLTRKH